MKIGYRIGGLFEDYSKEEGNIGFEIFFPRIYNSFAEAEDHQACPSAKMLKLDSGEVVIVLYDGGKEVETIHWDNWQRYKCYRVKESCKDSAVLDADEDFEPYSEKFEKIFELYCGGIPRDKWNMQYLAYCIAPVIIMDEDNLLVLKEDNQ